MLMPNPYGYIVIACVTLYSVVSEADTVTDNALNACIQKAMEKAEIEHAEKLETLKCHNKGIRNIDGLSQFKNLQSLSLFGNNINRADLTSLKQLKHLNLARNSLNQLQIKGLNQLETLYLFKNKLDTIDFHGLGALTKMRIMQNKLTALDISPLTSLSEAYLWDNQLEDLQINGLTQLTFLDVKQNPMPDELYDFYDQQTGVTISHDGNADDWK